jgi:CubicO group peptidase (beta-lactamase class C family)
MMNLSWRSLNTFILVAISLLYSCSKEEEEVYSWQPLQLGDGLMVSSAGEQGVDSLTIDETFRRALKLDNLYSLLILKNGYLIAEGYFNDMAANDARPTASVTKSITSALTGIAIRDSLILDTEKLLKDYFPEIEWESIDIRKSEITVEQILQMRTGYPWEEYDGYLETLHSTNDWIPFLEEFPLMHDPGTQFGYSNFTAHMMAIIIARCADQPLLSFAREQLFDEMGINIQSWPMDKHGYNYGSGDIAISPRSMAKFGQLYLDEGMWNDIQFIPTEWVERSLTVYSPNTYSGEILTHIRGLKYGYLWWTGTSGKHQLWFAWGYGGQMITIVDELDLVVVTTASVRYLSEDDAWPKSKAILELVGRFISDL